MHKSKARFFCTCKFFKHLRGRSSQEIKTDFGGALFRPYRPVLELSWRKPIRGACPTDNTGSAAISEDNTAVQRAAVRGFTSSQNACLILRMVLDVMWYALAVARVNLCSYLLWMMGSNGRGRGSRNVEKNARFPPKKVSTR